MINDKRDALIAAIHREESPGIIADLTAHLKRLQADSRIRTSELIQQGIMQQCAAQPEQAKPTAIALTDAEIYRMASYHSTPFDGVDPITFARAIERHLTAPHGESDKTVG